MTGRLSNQAIFDQAVQYFATTTKKSWQLTDQISLCHYRYQDGSSCVIGSMIPDELYRPVFEKHRIVNLLRRDQQLNKHFEDVHPYLLEALQHLHDCTSNWDQKTGKFTNIDNLRYIVNIYDLNDKTLFSTFPQFFN